MDLISSQIHLDTAIEKSHLLSSSSSLPLYSSLVIVTLAMFTDRVWI
ncbi:hypothetical protein AB3S75_027697 [Citrus x aurantiifolia]